MNFVTTKRQLLSHCLSPYTDLNTKQSTQGDSLYVLDGIRGLAVLIVIASHSAAFGMYGQGSLGVLLFFFLSGFVLALPYSVNPGKLFVNNELFRFAANRLLRIVPAYVVAVLFIAWLLDADFNWVMVNISFYKGWNHLWSVAEEVRFYLFFPVVIGLLFFVPSYVARICVVILLAYAAFRFRHLHNIDMLNGRFVSFYFWMFLGGMLTCLLYKWPLLHQLKRRPVVPLVISSAALIILLFLFFSSNHMISTFWSPLFPDLPKELKLNGWRIPEVWFLLFTVFLFSVTTFDGSWPSRLLQSYLLRHLGLLSYSLYLFHMPILLQLRRFGFKEEGMFFAVLGATYVVALLSYVIVEKPFLMLKPKPVSSI